MVFFYGASASSGITSAILPKGNESGGFEESIDLTLGTTPIVIQPADGLVVLTHDLALILGTFFPSGMTKVWNSTTNRYDFSEIGFPAQFLQVLDVMFTTSSPNTEIELFFGQSEDVPAEKFNIFFHSGAFKDAGAHQINITNSYGLENAGVVNNAHSLKMQVDGTTTVTGTGFFNHLTRYKV